jgi:AcrR family transcriptional regulator
MPYTTPVTTSTLAAPARPGLTRSRVLQTALAAADEHGLEELSMHRLGAELGVRAMSLYKHVKGKDGLLDGLVELLWSEVGAESPAPGTDWRDATRALAHSLRDVVHRHPRAAPLLMSRQLVPEEALRVFDAYIRVMLDGGVPEEHAVALLRSVFAYGFGYALAELSCLPTETAGAAEWDELARVRYMCALNPSNVPEHLLRVALKVCGDVDMSAQFARGIDLMIRGLDAFLNESVGG